MDTKYHILNAACNLLGISLLITAGLHITNSASKTFADEISWVSTVCFSISCVLSYLAIRSERFEKCEAMADRVFLFGLLSLLLSVAVLAFSRI